MDNLEEHFEKLSLESDFLNRNDWGMKLSKKLKTKYYILIPFKLSRNPLGCKNWKNETSVNFIARFSDMKLVNNCFKNHYDLFYIRFYYDKIKKNEKNEINIDNYEKYDDVPIIHLKSKESYIPENGDIKIKINIEPTIKITLILREEKNNFVPGKMKIERFLFIPHKENQRNFYEKYKINDHILAFITHLVIIEKKYDFEKKILLKSEDNTINSIFPEMNFIKALHMHSIRQKNN